MSASWAQAQGVMSFSLVSITPLIPSHFDLKEVNYRLFFWPYQPACLRKLPMLFLLGNKHMHTMNRLML